MTDQVALNHIGDSNKSSKVQKHPMSYKQQSSTYTCKMIKLQLCIQIFSIILIDNLLQLSTTLTKSLFPFLTHL